MLIEGAVCSSECQFRHPGLIRETNPMQAGFLSPKKGSTGVWGNNPMKGFSESLKAPAIGIRETPHAINLPVRETTPCNPIPLFAKQTPCNPLDASFPQSSLWVFRMLNCWFSATWQGHLPWWCQRHAVAFPPHCPLRPYRLTETARPMPNAATVTAPLLAVYHYGWSSFCATKSQA